MVKQTTTEVSVTRTLSLEARLVRAILGRDWASVLDTDAYKNAMAQAGHPLRRESFYLAFRREGLWYNPFDLAEIIRLLRPRHPDLKERGFLQAWGYGLTPAMEKALDAEMDIYAVPKNQWFGPREPVVRVTTASFLGSWLEPLGLMLHFPLQIATAICDEGQTEFSYSGADEAEIIRIVWEAVGMDGEPHLIDESEAYPANVRNNAASVVDALGGDASRAFEVGMRAATCIQQHRIALKACKREGIERTSNLRLAYELNMIPVGTTGHEHQMRFASDVEAFRAVRDTRPETPSYLFDTYDPLSIGIPAIIKVVLEDTDQRFSVRFDSGDQDAQFEKLWAFTREFAPHGNYIFEDSYNAEKTRRNESFLTRHGFPLSQAWYGYGGYLIANPSRNSYTRDRVSAAWKLCETAGDGRMKFSGSPGKESLPGCLVTFVCVGAVGERMIGQANETPPEGYVLLDFPGSTTPISGTNLTLSPKTLAMMADLRQRREAMHTA